MPRISIYTSLKQSVARLYPRDASHGDQQSVLQQHRLVEEVCIAGVLLLQRYHLGHRGGLATAGLVLLWGYHLGLTIEASLLCSLPRCRGLCITFPCTTGARLGRPRGNVQTFPAYAERKIRIGFVFRR